MSTAKAEITEYPKVSGQSVDVVEGSPLALIGVFVEIVRARFRGRNVGLPWLWKNDPTPEEWEENTPEKPHLIYIESQFQDNNESRNYRPAIFVGKGDTRPSKIILGHRAGIHRPTRLEGFFCLASVQSTSRAFHMNKARVRLLLISLGCTFSHVRITTAPSLVFMKLLLLF